MDEALTRDDAERLWQRAIPDGTGCFLWTGSKNDRGYGTVYWKGRNTKAHRAAYEVGKGPIPEGLCIDHLCRNPSCVNPLHLEAVTWRINTLRGVSIVAQAAKKTHCPYGHPYSGKNLYRRPNGVRECRLCKKLSMRERRNGTR